MAQTLSILGQFGSSGNDIVTFYTVPAATTAAVSTIVVSNTSSSADTFRIAIAVNGAADNIKQYIYRQIPIPGNNTFACTFGITMGAGDVMRCYSGSGNCSFSVFGAQNT